MNPDLERRLRQAGKKAHIARHNADAAAARRDDLIREAVADGATLREVAALAGVSHMAVSYIAHGRKRERAKS